MSAAVPPTPPPAPPPSATGGGQVVVQVVAADSRIIEAMRASASIEAVIQARPVKGMVEAITQNGAISLKLPPDLAALPAGSRLTLQFLNIAGGGLEAFRLAAVNGRPILPNGFLLGPVVTAGQGGAAPMPGTVPPGAILTGATPATARASLGAGAPATGGGPIMGAGPSDFLQGPAVPGQPAGIIATVLRSAAVPGAAPSASMPAAGGGGLPPNLLPGTTVAVRIAGTVPPGAAVPAMPQPGVAPQGPVPGQLPQSPAIQPSGGPTLTTPATPTPPSVSPQPQSGVIPPAPTTMPPSAAAPASATAPILTGTVTAHPPGGQVVIQTPVGALALPSPGPLPVGTQVLLEVIAPPVAPASTPSAKPEVLGPTGWPNLTETAQTLQRTDAQVAEQFLRMIPQANARLAASMVAFVGTLRSGDARQIVSDAITRGLERAGKRQVADALKGDVDALSADSTRTLGGGEWRAYTMPFMNGAEIDPIRLLVRNLRDDEGGKGKGAGDSDGHRFILEISMRQFGRVQLDGMIKRADKTFDLIMRTEAPLPADMRRDILAIFAENCEVCGTKGMVVFQSGRFVDLLPDASPTALIV